jgi:hypothetical protein
MPFRAKIKEDEELYRCARFCDDVARPLLESLPLTRESQAHLARFLAEEIDRSGQNFAISTDFLVNRVGCTDAHMIEHWQGTSADLGWLMVHEQLSDYFARFAIENWKPEVFLIHHVPKSAGTSVNEVVYRQSWFVAYPQTNFTTMVRVSGLMGFAAQLRGFEKVSCTDRIYIGGHFNLPDMLAKLGYGVRCQGISLTRKPAEAISSGIRYAWTMIEQGHPDWMAACPSLEPARLSAVRKAVIGSADPDALSAMHTIVQTITETADFRENYLNLLVKYYYNNDVQDVFALQRLFADHPGLVPCIDAARDEDVICWQLRIDGPLPHTNASLFSHADLARAFGGEDVLNAVTAPLSVQSAEIFGALCVLRALNGQ